MVTTAAIHALHALDIAVKIALIGASSFAVASLVGAIIGGIVYSIKRKAKGTQHSTVN